MSTTTDAADTAGSDTAIALAISRAELMLVCEALDSHVYWQLSDAFYRRDGYVIDPGSDDVDNAHQILEAQALADRLELVLRAAMKP